MKPLSRFLFALVILAALVLPAVAQDRTLTAAELSAGAFDVRIGGGASLSDSVAVGRFCTPIGLQMPAAWTDAVVTFRAAVSSETPQSLFDGFNTEVSLTVAAARYVVLDPSQFLGIRVIQLRSGIASSAVNQAAARTIKVVCR